MRPGECFECGEECADCAGYIRRLDRAETLLRRVVDFHEGKGEERLLRMDVRAHLGITGEGKPWRKS